MIILNSNSGAFSVPYLQAHIMKLQLYTTLGCHLCEQAESMLQQLDEQADKNFSWEAVEIAVSDAMVENYGERIPVIKRADTEEEIGWPFTLQQLERWLQT